MQVSSLTQKRARVSELPLSEWVEEISLFLDGPDETVKQCAGQTNMEFRAQIWVGERFGSHHDTIQLKPARLGGLVG